MYVCVCVTLSVVKLRLFIALVACQWESAVTATQRRGRETLKVNRAAYVNHERTALYMTHGLRAGRTRLHPRLIPASINYQSVTR